VYDQYGEEGLKAGGGQAPHGAEGGMPGFSFSSSGGRGFRPAAAEDVFSQFFGGRSPFGGGMGGMDEDAFSSFGGGMGGFPGGMGGMGGMGRQRGPAIVQTNFSVSLPDLYKGCTKKMKINPPKGEPKTIEINVKPGWKDGTKLKFPNQYQNQMGQEVTVEFVLQEQAHPRFKRELDTLVYSMDITLGESLLGFSKTIETLDGRQLPIARQLVTKPNFVLNIPGEGMPNQKTGVKGVLLVRFNVNFPYSLTEDQKVGLKMLNIA